MPALLLQTNLKCTKMSFRGGSLFVGFLSFLGWGFLCFLFQTCLKATYVNCKL
jgi:hypothetical protein